MKRTLTLLCLAWLVLPGCQKLPTAPCPKPELITLNTNSPVIVGAPLKLTTTSDMGRLYRWSGPNGFFLEYSYYSNSAYAQGKQSTVMADSGLYKVELVDDNGCVAQLGMAYVKIIPVPSPPCSIPANKSVSVTGFIGGNSFNPYFTNDHTIEAYGNGETLYLIFDSNSGKPKPGVYKSSGTVARSPTEVAVYFKLGAYLFSSAGQDVYVNKIGDKYDIGFCNHTLSNSVSSTPLIVSAHIVEK